VHLVRTGANTQLALASYLSDRAQPAATPAGLLVLTMSGQKIRAGLWRKVCTFAPDAREPES
jgi:hypothetical protein